MGNDLTKHYPQSELQGKELPDGSRCSPYYIDDDPSSYIFPDASTIYEAFQRGHRLTKTGRLFGRRLGPDQPYEWVSYAEVSEMADALGAGLVSECGLQPNNETNVGIFSQNRVEWMVTDQALARFSMVSVPLYSTLGREAVTHIIEQAELSVVVVDTVDKVRQLVDIAPGALRCLVLIEGEVDEETQQRVDELGWRLLSFNAVMQAGRDSPMELNPSKSDDIYTICYTSGTTGTPKGVVLRHSSLLISVYTALNPLEKANRKVTLDDSYFSYLPLAHIYERMAMAMCMACGCQTAFFSGDVLRLFDDIQLAKPTIFSAVPRILHRVYDKVYNAAGHSGPQRAILDWAVSSKMKDLQLGILNDDTVWDKLVFHKVRDLFGGRVRHFNTGSAAISPVVMNFFRVALNCTIYSGYGQTETGGVATVSAPFDFRGDHVGGPIACTKIKLIDVPELGYFVDKGYGEVLVHGLNAMSEYYKMPEKTLETLDEDGWIHTGDIGTWTYQGNLKIIDRCKLIFKLSQGEYIAPDRVEGVYLRCPHVAQVYIDGHSDKDFLVAVVVPDFEVFTSDRKEKSVDPEAICRDPKVKELIIKEMSDVGRNNDLKGFEIVRNIHLHPTPFSVEDGLLTVTLKSRRHELKKRFAAEVAALYEC